MLVVLSALEVSCFVWAHFEKNVHVYCTLKVFVFVYLGEKRIKSRIKELMKYRKNGISKIDGRCRCGRFGVFSCHFLVSPLH